VIEKLTNCRICGNKQLELVVDLGEQALTGVFLKDKAEYVSSGPLRLVKCHGDDCCGLLQLDHTYDLDEMYGDNYGYRSGLNASMVKHLNEKVTKILSIVNPDSGDLVIDIGSNDSSTLQAYPKEFRLVGIDPTGKKFKRYYPEHIELIPDFFTKEKAKKLFGTTKAKIITSFSMFYDLPSPMQFMQDIYDVLDDDGVWVFEQSYMPTMLEKNSYDTICHEHLEFYSLQVIHYMTEKIGFNIIDVEFNDINGGSFSVMVAKKTSAKFKEETSQQVNTILKKEQVLGLQSLEPYLSFQKRAEETREALLDFLRTAKVENKTVYGLGASTKGNVILQFCNITEELLPAIGEVNEEKFSTYTPGTGISILSEEEILQRNPDYLLVLPWHFRSFFVKNKKFTKQTLSFPLPYLEHITLIGVKDE